MKRSPWPVAMLGCALAALGCAKQVPSPDLQFSSQQKVVLSFRGGEQVRGRIDLGSKVLLQEPGVLWEAEVGEISDDKIALKKLVRVREDHGVGLQVARVEDYRRDLSGPVPDKILLRSEITGVDIVKVDPARTARNATFWTYGAVVLALLLGERS